MNLEAIGSFDDLKLWNVEKLKDYLRDRRIPVTGSSDQLRATVWGAMVYFTNC